METTFSINLFSEVFILNEDLTAKAKKECAKFKKRGDINGNDEAIPLEIEEAAQKTTCQKS